MTKLLDTAPCRPTAPEAPPSWRRRGLSVSATAHPALVITALLLPHLSRPAARPPHVPDQRIVWLADPPAATPPPHERREPVKPRASQTPAPSADTIDG